MGQFVGDQAATGRGARLVLAGAKGDGGADREGAGVDRAGEAPRVGIAVDADPAEVDAEPVLEEPALAGRQRLAAPAQRPNPCPDIAPDRAGIASIRGAGDGHINRQAPHRVIVAGRAPPVDRGARLVVLDACGFGGGGIIRPHHGLGHLLRLLLGCVARDGKGQI